MHKEEEKEKVNNGRVSNRTRMGQQRAHPTALHPTGLRFKTQQPRTMGFLEPRGMDVMLLVHI